MWPFHVLLRLFLAAGLVLVFGCSSAPRIAPGVEPATPVRTDPRLCEPLEDEPKIEGSIVKPMTPEGVEGLQRFMDAEIGSRIWGRRGWSRAKLARDTLC